MVMLLILITLMILSHIFLSPTTWGFISSFPFLLCSPQMNLFESPLVYLPAFKIWAFLCPVASLSLYISFNRFDISVLSKFSSCLADQHLHYSPLMGKIADIVNRNLENIQDLR